MTAVHYFFQSGVWRGVDAPPKDHGLIAVAYFLARLDRFPGPPWGGVKGPEGVGRIRGPVAFSSRSGHVEYLCGKVAHTRRTPADDDRRHTQPRKAKRHNSVMVRNGER